MENVLKGIGIGIVAVYVIITIYHLSQGFGFGAAIAGGFVDIRAVFVCWGEWGDLKDFLTRPAIGGDDLGPVVLDFGTCR